MLSSLSRSFIPTYSGVIIILLGDVCSKPHVLYEGDCRLGSLLDNRSTHGYSCQFMAGTFHHASATLELHWQDAGGPSPEGAVSLSVRNDGEGARLLFISLTHFLIFSSSNQFHSPQLFEYSLNVDSYINIHSLKCIFIAITLILHNRCTKAVIPNH